MLKASKAPGVRIPGATIRISHMMSAQIFVTLALERDPV